MLKSTMTLVALLALPFQSQANAGTYYYDHPFPGTELPQYYVGQAPYSPHVDYAQLKGGLDAASGHYTVVYYAQRSDGTSSSSTFDLTTGDLIVGSAGYPGSGNTTYTPKSTGKDHAIYACGIMNLRDAARTVLAGTDGSIYSRANPTHAAYAPLVDYLVQVVDGDLNWGRDNQGFGDNFCKIATSH